MFYQSIHYALIIDVSILNFTVVIHIVKHLIVVTQAQVLCLICTPEARGPLGPRAEGGHIRQSTSDCVTTIM